MANPLKYLAGYSATLTDQIHRLIDNDKLAEYLLKKYPSSHDIRTDKALYAYVMAIKNSQLRQSNPLSKVVYDDQIDVVHNALGLHAFVSRIQGGNTNPKMKFVSAQFLKMYRKHF
jgi:predicted transcriptional regulator